MTLAAILYRHLGQSVPAVRNCPGSPGQLKPLHRNLSRLSRLSRRKTGSKSVTERQRAFLNRDPLVTEADLSRLQKQLLPHLAECRDCVIEPHRYCATAEADGWAYQCLLTDYEDADQLHAAFVGEVIRARICSPPSRQR